MILLLKLMRLTTYQNITKTSRVWPFIPGNLWSFWKSGGGFHFSPRGMRGWMCKQFQLSLILNWNYLYIKVTSDLYIKLWTLSTSTLNLLSSKLASLFLLELCHLLNIFLRHFVAYCVDFGIELSKNSLPSSALFGFGWHFK